MTNQQLRVGAVSYLNTKPLVHRLDERAPGLKLVFDLPSRLADQLATGQLDVALIPSIEFLQNPAYQRVSDACIGCVGPVLSVKLYSRVAPQRITSLALDEGSRTSAAMVQIWLDDQFDVRPEVSPLAIGDGLFDAKTDAVLLIGDRAIGTHSKAFPFEWDMGRRWVDDYGTPFVFAIWTALPDVDVTDIESILSEARDSGLANLPEIAAQECGNVHMLAPDCLSYLRDNLYFHFGAEQSAGLELFREKAARLGFLMPAVAGETN